MSSLESSIGRIAGTGEARVRSREARVRLGRVAALAALVFALMVALAPGSALASLAQSPQWTVTSRSEPTYLSPGGTGVYRVEVENTGGAASDGSEITVNDVLPSGLTAAAESASGIQFPGNARMQCSGLACTYSGVLLPGESLLLKIPVEVAAGAPASLTNIVTVSGGGAPAAIRETPTRVASGSAPFGIAPGSTATALSSGQGGAHADLTTTLSFDTDSLDQISGAAKESGLELPPGFVIDVANTPKCPISTFSEQELGFYGIAAKCSIGAQIGTATLSLKLFGSLFKLMVPLYNLFDKSR